MRKLQEGDIIKKNNHQREIMGVCGKAIFLDGSNTEDKLGVNVSDKPITQKWLEKNGWELVGPEWKPKYGDTFYLVDLSSKDFYRMCSAGDVPWDKLQFERGLAFKTPEETIAKAKLMLSK